MGGDFPLRLKSLQLCEFLQVVNTVLERSLQKLKLNLKLFSDLHSD